jgi:hypothetical protein
MLFNKTGPVDAKGKTVKAPKNPLYTNMSGTVKKFMEGEQLKPRMKIDIGSLTEVDTHTKNRLAMEETSSKNEEKVIFMQ